jgi:eukaryotic-like serine/threonine-protein kinase
MKKGHDRIRDFLREEPDNRPRVGKYRLVREIGRGGMGIVYEAEDPELHRRVALKILREAEADPHVIRRLHREAAIAAQLQHPNIVGIYEVGEVTTETGLPQHFIAMAFVDGKTLAELLEEGRTPLPDLVRILEEVTRAVAFAHSRGVIHRDLKPDNILIDSNGRVVLTDFGLAHAESFLSRLTP